MERENRGTLAGSIGEGKKWPGTRLASLNHGLPLESSQLVTTAWDPITVPDAQGDTLPLGAPQGHRCLHPGALEASRNLGLTSQLWNRNLNFRTHLGALHAHEHFRSTTRGLHFPNLDTF